MKELIAYENTQPVESFMRERHVEQIPEADVSHLHIRVGHAGPGGRKVSLVDVIHRAAEWLERHGLPYTALKSITRSPHVPHREVELRLVQELPERRQPWTPTKTFPRSAMKAVRTGR